MAKPIAHRMHRLPFLCLDARWSAKWKWLWDDFAGPNEGYDGYITAWDSIPWQRVAFDDGTERDNNFAAPAQYRPMYGGYGDYHGIYTPCVESGLPETYCHNCCGLVGDLIALLEHDRIADSTIEAQYAHTAMPREIALRNLLFRGFNPAGSTGSPNALCPLVFSRPMTYTFGEHGHIGDNSMQSSFIRFDYSCDGAEGLRESLGVSYRREFFADAIWFTRNFSLEEFNAETAETAERNYNENSALSASSALRLPEIPESARLVVYIIAAGSVPRIRINGTWHIVTPPDFYFPPYGDPYFFATRAVRSVITDHGLRPGALKNEIIIEHITPRSGEIGAQVIFAFEWRGRPMPEPIK